MAAPPRLSTTAARWATLPSKPPVATQRPIAAAEPSKLPVRTQGPTQPLKPAAATSATAARWAAAPSPGPSATSTAPLAALAAGPPARSSAPAERPRCVPRAQVLAAARALAEEHAARAPLDTLIATAPVDTQPPMATDAAQSAAAAAAPAPPVGTISPALLQRWLAYRPPPSGHRGAPPSQAVPGQPGFLVDTFNKAALASGAKHFFLTHFHADHYQGLGKGFAAGTVYCCAETLRLVRLKLRVRLPPPLLCLPSRASSASFVVFFCSWNGVVPRPASQRSMRRRHGCGRMPTWLQ